MKNNEEKIEERREIYYYIAVGLTGIILLSGIVIYILLGEAKLPFLECTIYKLTGIFCPACGGTRAVLALIKGHFAESLFYNPVVLYTVIVWIMYMGINTVILLVTHSQKKMIGFKRQYIFIGLVLLLINFIVKNI